MNFGPATKFLYIQYHIRKKSCQKRKNKRKRRSKILNKRCDAQNINFELQTPVVLSLGKYISRTTWFKCVSVGREGTKEKNNSALFS